MLHWYVDASFATHHDMRGHTGGALTMGRGCPTVQSTKAKCNTRSSTISELVAVNEMMAQILWTRLFMKAQGIEVSDNILYQDKKVKSYWRRMDESLAQSAQSISRSGTTTWRIVLKRATLLLCGAPPTK